MGAYLLYVFLFAIGLPADLWTVFSQVPMMFVFCLVIALTNLVVTFAFGRLLGLNLEDLALSVNATLGGAALGRGDGHLAGLVEAGVAGATDRHLGLHHRHGYRPGRRAARGRLVKQAGSRDAPAIDRLGY